MSHWLCVLVPTPAYASLTSMLTYRSEAPCPPGTLVRVPLGKRETLGVVWEPGAAGPAPTAPLSADKVRSITDVLPGIAPLSNSWRQLLIFTARYYQRSVGELALAALPPQLRELSPQQVQRKLQREKSRSEKSRATQTPPYAVQNQALRTLTAEQAQVAAQIQTQPGPFLLFGSTGSGKTEVYLHCVQHVLQNDPSAQALVMVPEINLTPQLEARFKARFAPLYGEHAVVSMHSGMTPAQRLKSWLLAHDGSARILLGTRMAVFASLAHLQLIVVDEEHDPSYKSADGARYSARDLAIYRGQLENAKVLLGSATPSLESWHHSRAASEGGRYLRLHMPSRIGMAHNTDAADAADTAPSADETRAPSGHHTAPISASSCLLPRVRRVDMNQQPRKTIVSAPLLAAIQERVARGEQCMVFLNRRGYAPVLTCHDCGWKSACPHCSAFRVFHKTDLSLRCHHCGLTEAVPRACPSCGNPDISPQGRGTEQIEEHLATLLADVRGATGEAVRIARIDADSTRLKGALQSQLAAVHAGDVDVLVGTQMIAKGHDFRRITLVAAINPDDALFSSDFRAPERLFSLLLQAGGRAGRDASLGAHSEVWLQTFQPTHPLYAALARYDYPGFAAQQLREREQAGMPPFSAQALVRAEARQQEVAQAFLNLARQAALTGSAQPTEKEHWEKTMELITIYPAVPMGMQRIANIERAQMLVESPSRAALQRFLSAWHSVLHATRKAPECKGLVRWAVDVDPLAI